MKKTSLLIILLVSVFTSISLSQNKFGINISGGYTMLLGDFKEYYNNSFMGTGSAFMDLKSMQISLASGYTVWNSDKEAQQKLWEEQGGEGTLDLEAPATAIPLMLNIKYYLGKMKKVKPYILLAGGVNFITVEYTGQLLNDDLPGGVLDIDQSDSFSETTLALGIGAAFPVSKKASIDLNIKYNIMNDSEVIGSPGAEEQSLDARTLSFISLMVGVDYTF
jgi:opacity protein-like surface antigen